jgi:hypothetical protein
MLQVISQKSTGHVVRADREHVSRVIAERRRRCTGEDIRYSPQIGARA